MTVSLAASSAYQVGQYTALVILAVLFVALILRYLGVYPHSRHVQLDVRGPVSAGRRPRRGSSDAIAIGVVGVLLLGGLVRAASHSSDPWATQQGRDTRAGFLDGCNSSTRGALDCNCAFAHLTSQPPYDTPAGFQTLSGPLSVAERTRNLRDVPPAYLAAARACIRATPPRAVSFGRRE